MILSDFFVKANDLLNDFYHHVNAPMFRRSFSVETIPEKAEITICGLGFYKLFINGKEITKGILAPYISAPSDLLYYDNYDVAPYLTTGENVIGVILGNGMHNCPGGVEIVQHIRVAKAAIRTEKARLAALAGDKIKNK